MDYRTIAPQSWIYLSFQDDNHRMPRLTCLAQSWIYLSFQDDNHHLNIFFIITMSWIYLSFQDDNHPACNACWALLVGYTFHFKMITTNNKQLQKHEQLDIPFISR